MKRVSALLALVAMSGCSASVSDGPLMLGTALPVGDVAMPISSIQERRFGGVVRQKYDFSCGSAALATLLHHHYGDPRSEAEIFQGMWRDGDRAQIRKVGFSLLDMKRYLASRGISADGYRVPLARIEKRSIPGIALITIKGYRHFVVVKGVGEADVLVGDPALGLRTMTRNEFQAAWNGIYFAVNGGVSGAKGDFNQASAWNMLARAPTGDPAALPVSQQALMLTAPFYRDF